MPRMYGFDPSMDNQQATEFELGWLMGFIEGEGAIGLYWNQIRMQIYPVIILVNTEKPLINEANRILKAMGVGNYVKPHKITSSKANWKDRYDIYISGIKRCNKLISLLLPFWTIASPKRKRAQLVQEFCQSRLSHPIPEKDRYTLREHEILKEFQAFNRRTSEATPLPAQADDMVHPAVKIGE